MKDVEIISKYFPNLNSKQAEQFAALQKLYADWNAQINVISRKDIEHLYERHILHSLSIALFVKFKAGATILDVGTGGGFPGIPLAILFPDTNFLLIDSIGKKIKVVKEISSSLGLKNIRAEQIRAEEIKEKFDFVISRAVAAFPKFYEWIKGKIVSKNRHAIENGILYLKGGDLEEEMKTFKSQIQIIPLSKYFNEEFFETKSLVYLPFK